MTSLKFGEFVKHPVSAGVVGFSSASTLVEIFSWRKDINKEDTLRYASRAIEEKIERDLVDGLGREFDKKGLEMPNISESVTNWRENIQGQRTQKKQEEKSVA